MKLHTAFTAFLIIILYSVDASGQDPVPYRQSGYTTNLNNYVRTWVATAPITDPAILISSTLKDTRQTTTYVDGLGRPVETVVKRSAFTTNPADPVSATSAVDMVSPVVYDEFGREVRKFLPFAATQSTGGFKFDAFDQQKTFYDNELSGQNESYYYSKTDYEPSPLKQADKIYAAGGSWVHDGKGVSVSQWTNTATDAVKIWSVADATNSFGTYTAAASPYPAGVLSKTITLNEHNKQVIEFKDKDQRLIFKKLQLTAEADNGTTGSGYTGWLCIYYIYDDHYNLRGVIQPNAVAQLAIDNWQLTTAMLDEQCFRYEYDERNRMIMKKVPGAAPVEMVYDVRDRLVFSRDGNLAGKGKWMTIFYDELNRPVMTALYTSGSTRSALQTSLNQANGTTQTITNTIPGIADLVISNYDGSPRYAAATSVTLENGFDSGTGTELLVEIDAAASIGINTVTVTNPLPALDPSLLYPLTYTYYDNYNFTGATAAYVSDLAKPQSGTNSYPEPAGAVSSRTRGRTTGSRVRVLQETEKWITTTIYYDKKGRVIQTTTNDGTGNKDIVSTLYDFSGKALSTYQRHSNPRSALVPHNTVLTMLSYDEAGRLLKITKQLNDDGVNKVIAANEYNKLDQLKTKTLGDNLEKLQYEYNIRGWLKSINKDYANATVSTNYFGQLLSYNDGGTKPQYNGNISRVQWRGKADIAQRAYDFDYDATDRLLKADFTQYSNGWNISQGVNFSVSNLSYDPNGNILTMNQHGLKQPGSSEPIDQLQYTYLPASNKLAKVEDGIIDPTSELGDFKDGSNGVANDYDYDPNGNLKVDNNKNISQIVYNHLNLPELINISDKGSIRFIYDAAGNKLSKVVTDNTLNLTKVTTTDYLSGFVYQNDVLQYIGHEEGRIRPVFQSGQPVKYYLDYFIKDHLGNVRTVLTEETDLNTYAATMETAQTQVENALYRNIDNTRSTKPAGYPSDGTTNPNDYLARLHAGAGGQKIGPSLVLRVMAGDKIQLGAKAFYKSTGTSTSSTTIPDMLGALLQAFSTGGGSGTGGHGTGSGPGSPISTSFSATSYQQLKDKDPTQNVSNKPKAYLNFVMFDDQFNLVNENSGVRQVQGSPDQLQTLATSQFEIVRTGFLYVYTSNESVEDVFFDNVVVQHTTGPLLEETHYYPYGLTMSGISSKAIGSLENKKEKFQGQPFDDDLGLNWYGFKWRNHDPQIGRFIQIDPLSDKYVHNSTYAFSENKVTAHVELEGLESISIQGLTDKLWNTLGFSKSYSGKEFTEDLGAAAKRPENYAGAVRMMGQVTVMGLATVMTDGIGSGTITTTGIQAIRNSVATTIESGEISLAVRATEIQRILPLATQSRTTTAVASATTAEGNSVTLVGSSELRLRPAQRAILNPGEVAVSGKGHAEVTLLNYAQANNITVNAVAASRPICPGCAVAINNAGAIPASPLKVVPTPPQPIDATFVKKPITP